MKAIISTFKFLVGKTDQAGMAKRHDWFTTVGGFIGGLGVILPFFGVPQEVAAAFQTIGLWVLGWYSSKRFRTPA